MSDVPHPRRAARTWMALHDCDPTAIGRRTWTQPLSSADRLRVPIGWSTSGSTVQLDLKAEPAGGHGPHGIVVGTHESGLTTFVDGLLFGLTVRHSPNNVNFFLIDGEGGGDFAKFDNTGYCSGVVENPLHNGNNLIRRLDTVLRGELDHRKRLAPTPIPDLLVVSNGVERILTQRPEFGQTLTDVAKHGPRLGIHLVLAASTLHPAWFEPLAPALRWRIALKTLSPDDSIAAIGTMHSFSSTAGSGYRRVLGYDPQPVYFDTPDINAPIIR